MDCFKALWDNPQQYVRPPDEEFQMLSVDSWESSSTHKILTGVFKCPLPAELDDEHTESKPNFVAKKSAPPLRKEKPALRSNSKLTDYVPGLVKQPKFPRSSSMSRIEQQNCYALFQKFRNLTAAQCCDVEYHLFQSLMSRATNEQQEYMQYVKSCWPKILDRASTLTPWGSHFVEDLWKDRTSYALSRYPAKYRKSRDVPLTCSHAIPVVLKHHKSLLQMGRVPVATVPSLSERCRMQFNVPRLRSTANILEKSTVEGTLHQVPVSGDPNAEKLGRLNQANIVISSGGLKCLLDNRADFGRSWSIPITVKDYHTFVNGVPGKKKIIFIDKPLPEPDLSGPERIRCYQKYSLKAEVLSSCHKKALKFEIQGAEYRTTLLKNRAATMKTNKSKVNMFESDIKIEPGVSQLGSQSDSSPDTSCVEESKVQNVEESPSEIESSRHTLPICTTNVTYNLWKMFLNVSDIPKNNLLAIDKQEFNILVRCSLEGIDIDSSDLNSQTIALSCKAEHQIEYGGEAMSLSELTREWAALKFRPGSKLVRARINVINSDVIKIDKCTVEDLANDSLRLYGVRLADTLRTLYATFQDLQEVAVGEYLLTHNPKNGAFAELLIKSSNENEEVSKDLTKIYGNVPGLNDLKVAWPPLDPHVVLPVHNLSRVLPCMFRPERAVIQKRKPAIENVQEKEKTVKKRGRPRKKPLEQK